MTGEDIIQALNGNIESKRKQDKINATGHLVLLRTTKTNPTFKAYKTYEAIIYFVAKRKKYRVLSCTLTAKVLDGQEERMKEDIDIKLINDIFNFIQTEYYNQIIRGEYYGGADTE